MEYHATLKRLIAALAGPLPGPEALARMAVRPRRFWQPGKIPEGRKAAAGLLLVYPSDGDAAVLLTGRSSRVMVSPVGSFVAGTISIMGLMVAATFLSDIALKFGPPEFFALTLCGLIVLVRLGGGSILQGFIMVLLGMAVATVGVDYLGGVERFTYGIQRLGEGISFLPVAMGIFGIAEVLVAVGQKEFLPPPKTIRLRELMPTRPEWKRAVPAMFRGSFVGFALGLIPGPSTVISTFVSYMTEKTAQISGLF